jgi:hypothetical protein
MKIITYTRGAVHGSELFLYEEEAHDWAESQSRLGFSCRISDPTLEDLYNTVAHDAGAIVLASAARLSQDVRMSISHMERVLLEIEQKEGRHRKGNDTDAGEGGGDPVRV